MTVTDGLDGRAGASTVDFSDFFQDKLRPVIADVARRKRSALTLSLSIGVGVFVVVCLTTYLFFSPYAQLLGEHGISYWPILILLPAALAVISFSISYILKLRAVVKGFREDLVGRMTEYIDSGVLHESNRPMPEADLEYSLLFETLGKPIAGDDFFRGRAGAARVEFTDVRLAAPGGEKKGGRELSGLFFRAVYPGRFRMFMQSLPDGSTVSIGSLTAALRDAGDGGGELVRLDDSGHGRQAVVESEWQGLVGGVVGTGLWTGTVEELRKHDIQTLASFRGNVMSIAMLTWKERLDFPGIFDGFDFGHCREFCRDARLCLELAKEMGGNAQAFRSL